MVNMLHQIQRAEIGFDVSKVVISTSAQQRPWNTTEKFNDAELKALLDEDSTQILKQLAKALEVDQGTISKSYHATRKIQKEGKCVPYELKERDIER